MTHSRLSLHEALDAVYAAGPEEAVVTQAQARLRRTLQNVTPAPVFYDVLWQTPIGPVFVALNARGLLAVRFDTSEKAFRAAMQKKFKTEVARAPHSTAAALRQVSDYLAGKRVAFDLPVDLSALTEFQRNVLQAATQIPRGQVATYSEIARRIHRPKAARAVGQALRNNPMPIVIPCHRVLATDGSLRGYLGKGGTQTKAHLLALEGVQLN